MQNPSEYWNTHQVAEYLGIGHRSVYSWLARHEMYPAKIDGGLNYYLSDEISKAKGGPKTRPECQCEACRGSVLTVHGASCYVNYKCRCAVCVGAAVARSKRYKEAAKRRKS